MKKELITVGAAGPTRHRAGLFLALLLVLVPVFVGCGGSRREAAEPTTMLQLDAEDLARADRLFARMQQEHDLRRDRQAMQIGFELLDRYPSFPRRDEVARLAIDSARRLGDVQMGRRLAAEFLTDHPDSPLLPNVLVLSSELAAAAGDTLAAAEALIELHDVFPDVAAREEVWRQLDAYIDSLDPVDRNQLFAEHDEGELATYLGFRRVEGLLIEGEFDAADDAVAELRDRDPTDRWVVAATELVAAPPETLVGIGRRPGTVVPGRVGIIAPLTGRYAVLGNAFVDGAQLALDQVTASISDSLAEFVTLDLVVEDSAGDPVAAALATRRLCGLEGSSVVVGALLSAPTAAAALVCDHKGVPLISPTATHDRLEELGAGIFQTNQTEAFEAEVLAQLTAQVLMKRRFAVLHPRGREGEESAAIFANAVERWGGEVLVSAAFSPEATDFRAPIREIRAARPEVIYVPAGVDQMVMLGPQLDFYQAGSLILGPSEWSAPKLVEQAGSVMQRAVFVSDVALFPAGWTADFESDWRGANYPPEATALALRSYQATRMAYEAMARAEEGHRGRSDLAAALGRRLTAREFQAEGPEAFARTLLTIRGEDAVPFPAEIFAETWTMVAMADSAAADSLGFFGVWPDSLGGRRAPADSLGYAPGGPETGDAF